MAIQVGDSIPDAIVRVLSADGPQEVAASEFFSGKKAVLFSVVGAFTGTCNNQMPTFLEHAGEIKAKGIDTIACVAVNDPAVLGAWAESLGVGDRVTLLSDGNAEFATAIGMSLDASGFGLGTRSLRYAMVVDDGKVTALHVEENPGVCTVTDAPSILEEL